MVLGQPVRVMGSGIRLCPQGFVLCGRRVLRLKGMYGLAPRARAQAMWPWLRQALSIPKAPFCGLPAVPTFPTVAAQGSSCLRMALRGGGHYAPNRYFCGKAEFRSRLHNIISWKYPRLCTKLIWKCHFCSSCIF